MKKLLLFSVLFLGAVTTQAKEKAPAYGDRHSTATILALADEHPFCFVSSVSPHRTNINVSKDEGTTVPVNSFTTFASRQRNYSHGMLHGSTRSAALGPLGITAWIQSRLHLF
jgi:hypothetical protein